MVAYPSTNNSGEDVTSLLLTGSGLSSADEIEINNNAIRVCWPNKTESCSDAPLIARVTVDGQNIQLDGLKVSELHGPVAVKVALGALESDAKQVTISGVQPETPFVGAVAFVVAISLLIWLMVSGLRQHAIDGQAYGLITAFMLDPDTDTYSLAKFQFYIWTAAAVLAYAYVALSRSLVQGNLEFIDVPGTLPGILFISAGTFGISTGVTAAKGSKGAGQIQPSWSDLLTVGGVVVPERVQFVVWTIVSVAAFLALTLFIDPASITNLPAVPKNFLYLQGISAGGYLAGKIARNQGPVISSATGSAANPMLIDILGQGLSIRPGIRIDDRKIVYAMSGETVAAQVGTLETVSYDDHSLDKSFATQLRLRITDANTVQRLTQQPQAGQPAPEHTLSVTNPDGQTAVWRLTITQN